MVDSSVLKRIIRARMDRARVVGAHLCARGPAAVAACYSTSAREGALRAVSQLNWLAARVAETAGRTWTGRAVPRVVVWARRTAQAASQSLAQAMRRLCKAPVWLGLVPAYRAVVDEAREDLARFACEVIAQSDDPCAVADATAAWASFCGWKQPDPEPWVESEFEVGVSPASIREDSTVIEYLTVMNRGGFDRAVTATAHIEAGRVAVPPEAGPYADGKVGDDLPF